MINTLKHKSIIFCLIIANGIFSGYFISIFIFSLNELYISTPRWTTPSPLTIKIQQNDSISYISKLLYTHHLIRHESHLKKWLMRLNLDKKIQYGTFLFKQPPTLWHLIKTLSHSHISTSRITVLEGLNISQIAKRIDTYGFDVKIFKNLTRDPAFIKSLEIMAESLEGFLFPDTYFVNEGSQEDDLLRRMVKRFNEMIATLNLEQSVIYKTSGLYKGLIIASLIEKETHYLPDRPKVSAVFWNRIRENWRLDSDVTLHYTLDKWGSELTKQDLNSASPYNTRKFKGFPPTPICNPSLSSIKAAFFPEQNDYFFFIASGDVDGHCLFAKNLKEHNQIKQRLKKQGLF